MSPPLEQEQDEFTIPSQLYKSKLSLTAEKIIKKQSLRNKSNVPKMIVDSENEDLDEQQEQIAKKKAGKWWRKFDRKYYSVFQNIQQAENTINKVQQLPISQQKLGTYLEEEYLNQQREQSLLMNDTIRVLFRREITLDQKQEHALVFFGVNSQIFDERCSMTEEEQSERIAVINGQLIQLSLKIQEKLPSNVHIWSFRSPSKDPRNFPEFKNNTSSSLKATCLSAQQQLQPFIIQNSNQIIQNLLRNQKQNQLQASLDRQIRLWTRKYLEIFQKNENSLHQLANQLEKNIDERKLEEQLRQYQQKIVSITQEQLLWSQILLLFKKGHSDKTQQLLSDALEIITIKEMNMKESLKKKKSTSLQQLKSLFQTDCKICFSTQNDQKINKVFYCDGCNTSFHQICYGISKEEAEKILQLQKFYCDVCYYSLLNKRNAGSSKRLVNSLASLESDAKLTQKQEGKTKKPSCQICCKSNFPMKLINEHFYHVTCLFMFDLVQVRKSKIEIKENLSFSDILDQVSENQIQSGFCQFCLKYQGMKFKCKEKYCDKWFHPICAYLNGIQFNLNRYYRSLDVELFCQQLFVNRSQHQINWLRNVLNQIYIRRFFCDYKKTSNLTQEYFQEQYAKEIKDLSKERSKQLTNQNMLLRKGKTCKSSTSIGLLSLSNMKKNPSQNCNQSRLQLSIAQSSQLNQLDLQRNEIFQKIDHARYIEQDLDFD